MIALAAALALAYAPPVSAVGLYDPNSLPVGTPSNPLTVSSTPPASTPDTANGDMAATRTNTGNTASYIGPPGSTPPSSDTGSANVNGQMQRLAQNLTTVAGKLDTLISTVNTLLKSGQSVQVGNFPTGFNVLQGGAANTASNPLFGSTVITGSLPGFAATPTFNLGTAPTLTIQGSVTTGSGSTTAISAGSNLIGGVTLYAGSAVNGAANAVFTNGAAPFAESCAALAANGVCAEGTRDLGSATSGSYNSFVCYANISTSSTGAYLMAQWSTDNFVSVANNYDYSGSSAVALSANQPKTLKYSIVGRWNRCVLFNGSTAQSSAPAVASAYASN